ncbi:hypothetical protein MNB_SM-3-1465 [hydrothermal vent metagenome]|uniref:Uncharacterized protein n=1 Tax=hydrothermal vent metagenome TaxID=652676 RepID=A0A1W1D2K8_9ZZZZ
MANFEQHLNGAVVATGVAIVPLHSAGLLNVSESMIVLSLGIIGGVLPDIDSDTSKPVQIAFKLLSIFLPLLVLLNLPMKLPLLYLIGIWIVFSIVLHLTLFKFLLSLTRHRGIFHSIPMGVVLGQIIFLIFHYNLHFSLLFSTLAGLFLLYGFLIHLLLDEIVSLNLFGMKIKHSFGTALKLYDYNNILGTLFLYGFIVLFFMYVPIDYHIFEKIFNLFQHVKYF